MRLVQAGAVILLYALAICFFRDFYEAAIASTLSLYIATVVTVGWLFGRKPVMSAFEASLPYISGYSASFPVVFVCLKVLLRTTTHTAFLASFVILSSLFLLTGKVKGKFGVGGKGMCCAFVRLLYLSLIIIGCVFSYRFGILEIFFKVVFLIVVFYTVPHLTTLEVKVTHELVGEFPAEIIWVSSDGVRRHSLSLSKLRILLTLVKLNSSVVAHPWKKLDRREIEVLKKSGIETVRIQRKLPPYPLVLLSLLILMLLTLLVRLPSMSQRFVV